jgi:hypothetical protein
MIAQDNLRASSIEELQVNTGYHILRAIEADYLIAVTLQLCHPNRANRKSEPGEPLPHESSRPPLYILKDQPVEADTIPKDRLH